MSGEEGRFIVRQETSMEMREPRSSVAWCVWDTEENHIAYPVNDNIVPVRVRGKDMMANEDARDLAMRLAERMNQIDKLIGALNEARAPVRTLHSQIEATHA